MYLTPHKLLFVQENMFRKPHVRDLRQDDYESFWQRSADAELDREGNHHRPWR